MPRENEFYRAEVARLLEYFGPNKNLLSCKDVSRYCGITQNTARKRFEIGAGGISLSKFAMKMSSM